MKTNQYNSLIICDIDGTLIDLDSHFLKGLNHKLVELGLENYQLSREEYIKCAIVGNGFKNIGKELLLNKGLLWKKPFQLKKIEQALMDFYPTFVEKLFSEKIPQLRTSTIQLLRHEQKRGVKIAYVTNNTANLLQKILDNYPEVPQPDCIISQRDENRQKVNPAKPNPDMLLQAMKQCKAHPSCTYVLGNVPNHDGLAGLRAGIPFENILLQESEFLKACPLALRKKVAQQLGDSPTLKLQPSFPKTLAERSKRFLMDYPNYQIEVETAKSMYENNKPKLMKILDRCVEMQTKMRHKAQKKLVKQFDEDYAKNNLIAQKNNLIVTFIRKDIPNKSSFVIYSRGKYNLNEGKILNADWSGILAGSKKGKKNIFGMIKTLMTIRKLAHQMLFPTGLQRVYVEGEAFKKDIIFFSKYGMGFQQIYSLNHIKTALNAFFDQPKISNFNLKTGEYDRAFNSNETHKHRKFLLAINLTQEKTIKGDLWMHFSDFIKHQWQIFRLKKQNTKNFTDKANVVSLVK